MRTFFICAAALWLSATPVPAQSSQVEGRAEATACAAAGTSYTRTTLYFGLARPAGTISSREWKAFVRDEITSRFPQGFTIWEAHGQWRGADGKISRERAKVLLLVHANTATAREALVSLVESYKRRFQQESVLWETASVCAAF
jgi:Protein of unknown function (DUF3574)